MKKLSDKQCQNRLNQYASEHGYNGDDVSFYPDIIKEDTYTWLLEINNKQVKLTIDRHTAKISES